MIMTKSRGRELSCAFDAILQLVEIKSVEKALLLVFDGRARLGSANHVMGNHEGFVLKIARGGMHLVWAITKALC